MPFSYPAANYGSIGALRASAVADLRVGRIPSFCLNAELGLAYHPKAFCENLQVQRLEPRLRGVTLFNKAEGLFAP